MTRAAGHLIAAIALTACTSSALPDPKTYEVKGRLDARAIKAPYTMIIDGDVVNVGDQILALTRAGLLVLAP